MDHPNKQIKASEVCEIIRIAPATLNRWVDPDSKWYRPGFPPPRRYPNAYVRFWYLGEIFAWRDANLLPR